MPPLPVLSALPTAVLPDHTQLPETDGSIVENSLEAPQGSLLTESFTPRLLQLFPDQLYFVGRDVGIYWRFTQPVLAGCKSPDWYLVPGVPPMLDGVFRRSYVLWQETLRPLLVIEYVSGDGSEERDTTPYKGKFWVYERAIGASYYAIYEVEKASVEVYKLEDGRYHLLSPNANGRYAIPPLGVELGIWQGVYLGLDVPWLRVWDATTGELLPNAEERTQAERQRAEEERQRAEDASERAENAEALVDDFRNLAKEESERAEAERRRAEHLAERLRALGLDPDAPGQGPA